MTSVLRQLLSQASMPSTASSLTFCCADQQPVQCLACTRPWWAGTLPSPAVVHSNRHPQWTDVLQRYNTSSTKMCCLFA